MTTPQLSSPRAWQARRLGVPLRAALCLLATPAAAERAAVVSATTGEPSGSLVKGSVVADGQPISTGAAENMALVLEDDVLLELCSRSTVTLKRHAIRRAQIVKLDAGEARFVVSPRSPDDRIEVHTPSAIATILGTVVLVKHDPETGETTVTSQESQIDVRSSDPSVEGSSRVSPGEQVVVLPGRPPSRARKLPAPVFASIGDCLMDLENAALSADRLARRKKTLEQLASIDSAVASLPTVATPSPSPVDAKATGFWPANPEGIVDPTTEAQRQLPLPVPPPTPPPCNVGACLPGFP